MVIESENEHKIDPDATLEINVENQEPLKGQLHKMNENLLANIWSWTLIINSSSNLNNTCNLELDLSYSNRKMPIEVLH